MDSIGSIGSTKDNSERTKRVGEVFSGVSESGGGGDSDVGAAHKVEPCGKDSVHISDEARGIEK